MASSNGSQSTSRSKRPMLTESQEIVLNAIQKSYLDASTSDMKIFCGDEVFPAHRMILCAHSEYFRRAFSGSFREASGEFRFADIDPLLMGCMLEFAYNGFYTLCEEGIFATANRDIEAAEDQQPPPAKRPRTAEEPSGESYDPDLTVLHPSYFNVRMYGLADCFMIDSLKHYAKDCFCMELDDLSDWSFSPDIEQIVKVIYSTRGKYEMLKKPLLERIVRKYLRRRELFIDPEGLPLDVSPEFTRDLCIEALSKVART